MLFSNDLVARYINDAFEPAFEMVRPVPVVTIDFGNGNMITRTLHGNIATYVCTAGGEVLDILPGIYEPNVFRDQLDQLGLLAEYLLSERLEKKRQLSDSLEAYHRGQAKSLKRDNTPPRFERRTSTKEEALRQRRIMNYSKKFVEMNSELVVTGLVTIKKEQPKSLIRKLLTKFTSLTKASTSSNQLTAPISRSARAALPPDDLRHWQLLAQDTRLNETVRRAQIHEKLAEVGLVQPAQIKRWLYKEVLHADLDDPYLGLGESLFSNYPFQREDSAYKRSEPQTPHIDVVRVNQTNQTNQHHQTNQLIQEAPTTEAHVDETSETSMTDAFVSRAFPHSTINR